MAGSAFSSAFGGGLGVGSSLADVFFEGQNRRKLGQLEQLFKAGDYNNAGAMLAGMGQVGQGVNTLNIPYQREQQELQRDFQNQQAEWQRLEAAGNRDFRERNFSADQEYRAWQQEQAEKAARRANQPEVPEGYMFTDPDNPQAGVTPLPGLPTYKPSPSSPLGKIQADFEAGLIDQKTRDAAVAKATAGSNGITVNPDGTVQIGGSAKPATEGQSNANTFATRMEKSGAILDRLEGQGTALGQSLISGVPIAGNYFNTPSYRQYDQAKRDFINATLRKESGAAIAPSEFANADKQYFPQPGDDPQTIEQKRQNRLIATQTIREASGPFAIKGQSRQQEPAINVPSPQDAGKSRENAIPVSNEQEAENLPTGSYFILNGRVGRIK